MSYHLSSNGNGRSDSVETGEPEMTLLEPRPFRPFKSSEEYLEAMKEDLAEWLNGMYPTLGLTADNFCARLETGAALCRHANAVRRRALDYYRERPAAPGSPPVPSRDVQFRSDVVAGTFHARDNVSNFIGWCRALGVLECLLFETDDLVLRKNEKSFILCLLEVARRGAQVGMPAPLLVQLEQEIDRDIAEENARRRSGDAVDGDGDHHHHNHRHGRQRGSCEIEEYDVGPPAVPPPQIITNDLKSLDEMVRDLLNRCTCPLQFPMIRVAEGKYRIGDTKTLIYVRILRSHVMVRVGGGWDTLEHYLDKHDPCRCRQNHRPTLGAKLTFKQPSPGAPPSHMEVTYHRTNTNLPTSPAGGLIRQRSSSPPRQRRASTSSSSSSHTQPASSGSLNSLLGGDHPTNGNGAPSTDSSSDEGYRGGAPTPRSRPPPPRPVCLSDIQDSVRRQGTVHRTAGCAGLGSGARDSALGDDEDDDDDLDFGPDSSPDGPPPPTIRPPPPPPPPVVKPVPPPPRKSRIPEAVTATTTTTSSGRRQRRLSAEVAAAARGGPAVRLPRSRSHSNDAGIGTWSDSSPMGVFARQQAARRSLRPMPSAANRTVRRVPPATISADALDFLRPPLSAAVGLTNGRSQSASPRRVQLRGGATGRSLQTSPTKPLAPMLQRLVNQTDLDTDQKVLDHIRDLLQHYDLEGGEFTGAASPDSGSDMGVPDHRVAGRGGSVRGVAPARKKSSPPTLVTTTTHAATPPSRGGLSRIPIPTGYHSLPS